MLDLDILFKYIVTGGGAIIAYFFKSIHKSFKDQEEKVANMQNRLSKLDNKVELIDNNSSAQIEKLEDLSKIQFDQLHQEIGELKSYVNSINNNIQELVKSII
jgi:peptidoglycan hydrolase CwlO-like protein